MKLFSVHCSQMTTEELNSCISKHEKNQTQIGSDIGFSRSKMTRLTKGGKIDESDEKLFRLYFYGEIPFQGIKSGPDLGNVLSFTPEEWRIMEILSRRQGMVDTKAWIISQIRAYLDHNKHAQDVREEISDPNQPDIQSAKRAARTVAAQDAEEHSQAPSEK